MALLKAQQANGHDVVLYLKEPPETFANLGFPVRAVRDEAELYAHAQRDRVDCLHLHENVDSLPTAWLPLVLTAHVPHFVCLSATLFFKTSQQPCPHVYSPARCVWNHAVERCGSVRPQRLAAEFGRLRNERRTLTHIEVVVPSSRYRNLFLRSRFPEDRLHLVPHFVDPALSLLPALSADAAPHFLFVGRLEPNKGLPWLLRAMTKIPAEVHLDVAGAGTFAAKYRQMAETLGLASRVNFHGWIRQQAIAELARRSLALVVPSLWHETFGLVAIEMQARGRTVIASAVGGLEDIVENEVTGFLVQPGDIEGLAAAMRRMIFESGLVQKMGINGAKRMHEKFSLPLHLQALDHVYWRAAERNTAEPHSVDPVAPASSPAS